MIIAAYCGAGKGTIKRQSPRKDIGIISIPIESFMSPEADHSRFTLPDLQENYVTGLTELFETIRNDKEHNPILLIQADPRVLKILREIGMPYTLCYPQRDAKEIYRQRLIDKGDCEDFIRVFIDGWDYFMDALESDPCEHHIVLKPHQCLGDAIKILFIDTIQTSEGLYILIRDELARKFADAKTADDDKDMQIDEFWKTIISIADKSEIDYSDIGPHDVLMYLDREKMSKDRSEEYGDFEVFSSQYAVITTDEYDELNRLGLLCQWIKDPHLTGGEQRCAIVRELGYEIMLVNGVLMLGDGAESREKADALARIVYPRLDCYGEVMKQEGKKQDTPDAIENTADCLAGAEEFLTADSTAKKEYDILSVDDNTLAFLLLCLNRNKAAWVFETLDAERRTIIIGIMAAMNFPKNSLEATILTSMQPRRRIKTEEETLYENIEHIAGILSALSQALRNDVLSGVKEADEDLFRRIQEHMFFFEDIAKCNDRTIQRILRDTNNAEIAVALKMSSETVKQAIFSNISARTRAMIEDDMEIMGPVCTRDVEEAQLRIVNIVRKLEDEGEILVKRE